MNKNEYNLALSVSHNSSAALIKNGEIIVAVCEERSKRKKNYIGFPKDAVNYCLKKAGISGEDISRIAYTTINNPGLLVKAKTNTEFSLRDYRDYYGDRYYKKRLKGDICFDYLTWLRDDPKFNREIEYFDFSYLSNDVIMDSELEIKLFQEEQARLLASELGVSKDRIEFLDHHTCHAYYSYFGSPFRGEDCIVLTLDGWGDGRNQTVWIAAGDKLSLLAESAENDLGRIYKMATLLLGMRPDEHEFKVMGLAPYAKDSHVRRAKLIIDNLCQVEGMRITSKNRPQDLFSYLEENWKDHRFDNIAGAVQLYVEEIACQLVENIIAATGINRIVIGGGIAMNIKMNKAISEVAGVHELYVCGSSGDESLSIGGCYFLNTDASLSKPIKNLYLGYDINDDIGRLDLDLFASKFDITQAVTLDKVATLLDRGDIVAVIRGKAEFGARALGNRSILANPNNKNTVKKINEAIKNRDFWMPFALSILDEFHANYIKNPKKLESPFMAISLDIVPEKFSEIEAGCHPYDETVRPQFVKKETTPEYHRLISEFYKISGIPALLNTSFNLHGEPIVDTIEDAIRTFELSGLDHLLINDQILLSKRKSKY